MTVKKLDQGSMDFDLSCRNAANNEEYTDESMLLPRGTRLIVQRLPAAKGHGFLARMVRNQYGGGPPGPAGAGAITSQTPSGFYEIDSRARDEDDEEFVTSGGVDGPDEEEDQELAMLKAVTETAASSATAVGGLRPSTVNFGNRGGGPAGQGPPPKPQHHGQPPRVQRERANADPELREQEKKMQPKKRATGIPRTFLSLSAQQNTENTEGEEGGDGPQIQPNTMGFEQLKRRGGGQSESAINSKKSLDYALKITDTTVPDYLQCAICKGVALTAMFLTWDPEGRTTCEKCIRDALAQNGFRCPLTGMDGISPDDLRPNPGIRKAAEAFVKDVTSKIEEIEKQQVEEEPSEIGTTSAAKPSNFLEGEGGVVVTKRHGVTNKRKGSQDEDPFGGDDDFGGDVFAVQADEKPKVEAEREEASAVSTPVENVDTKTETEVPTAEETKSETKDDSNGTIKDVVQAAGKSSESAESNSAPQVDKRNLESTSSFDRARSPSRERNQERRHGSDRSRHNSKRRDKDNRQQRRGGPPAGYQMGPAGGANSGPPAGYHMGPAGGANGGLPVGYHMGPAGGTNGGPPAGYHMGPAGGTNGGPPAGYQMEPDARASGPHGARGRSGLGDYHGRGGHYAFPVGGRGGRFNGRGEIGPYGHGRGGRFGGRGRSDLYPQHGEFNQRRDRSPSRDSVSDSNFGFVSFCPQCC